MANLPSIALVTGTEMTRRHLAAQLEEVIGDTLDVQSYALDAGVRGTISADLVVVSSAVLLTEEAFNRHVSRTAPRIIAQRIINYNHLEELMALPVGTEVMLVNDVDSAALESITSLQKLGLDHLRYVPFTPGTSPVPDIAIAITPGEKDFVPQGVTRIIDMGPRLIDLTTILEILRHFDLAETGSLNLSEKYMNKIVQLGKALAAQNFATSALNSHLQLVLDGVREGILAFDSRGRVTVYNENLENILGVPYQKAIGKHFSDCLREPELLRFVEQGTGPGLFHINEAEVVVHRFYFQPEETVVCTFKNLQDDLAVQKQLRRELKNRGYVAKHSIRDIVGSSPEIRRIRDLCAKLAQAGLTILIEGESGTGKELFASAIHNMSDRKYGPFLAVNFSALPEELVESELFGYEEGAFTGARKGGKPGLFEQAEGGTIFLDEIGDISLKIQTRLLRVLQEKEIMRIGGSRIIPVDVRVIAATNRNLEEMINKGQFRQDLYHRLKVLYLHLPPLRQRKEDLEELFAYFIRQSSREQIEIASPVLEQLRQFDWYGNVRELKNTIDYMLAVCDGQRLTLADIPDHHFFQKQALNSRDTGAAAGAQGPSDLVSQWQTTGEDTIYRFMLAAVASHNKSRKLVGRKHLSELSQDSLEQPLTEQQVRHRLELMEAWGLITKARGRSGTKITSRGGQILSLLEK